MRGILLVLFLLIGVVATSVAVFQQRKQIIQNKAAEPSNPEFIQIVDASKGLPVGKGRENGDIKG